MEEKKIEILNNFGIGNYKECIKLSEIYIKENNDKTILHILGYSFLILKEYDKSRIILEELINSDINDIEIYKDLLNLYICTGDNESMINIMIKISDYRNINEWYKLYEISIKHLLSKKLYIESYKLCMIIISKSNWYSILYDILNDMLDDINNHDSIVKIQLLRIIIRMISILILRFNQFDIIYIKKCYDILKEFTYSINDIINDPCNDNKNIHGSLLLSYMYNEFKEIIFKYKNDLIDIYFEINITDILGDFIKNFTTHFLISEYNIILNKLYSLNDYIKDYEFLLLCNNNIIKILRNEYVDKYDGIYKEFIELLQNIVIPQYSKFILNSNKIKNYSFINHYYNSYISTFIQFWYKRFSFYLQYPFNEINRTEPIHKILDMEINNEIKPYDELEINNDSYLLYYYDIILSKYSNTLEYDDSLNIPLFNIKVEINRKIYQSSSNNMNDLINLCMINKDDGYSYYLLSKLLPSPINIKFLKIAHDYYFVKYDIILIIFQHYFTVKQYNKCLSFLLNIPNLTDNTTILTNCNYLLACVYYRLKDFHSVSVVISEELNKNNEKCKLLEIYSLIELKSYSAAEVIILSLINNELIPIMLSMAKLRWSENKWSEAYNIFKNILIKYPLDYSVKYEYSRFLVDLASYNYKIGNIVQTNTNLLEAFNYSIKLYDKTIYSSIELLAYISYNCWYHRIYDNNNIINPLNTNINFNELTPLIFIELSFNSYYQLSTVLPLSIIYRSYLISYISFIVEKYKLNSDIKSIPIIDNKCASIENNFINCFIRSLTGSNDDNISWTCIGVYCYINKLLYNTYNYKIIVSLFKNAIRIKSKSLSSLLNLSIVYYNIKLNNDALNNLQLANIVEPNRPYVWYLRCLLNKNLKYSEIIKFCKFGLKEQYYPPLVFLLLSSYCNIIINSSQSLLIIDPYYQNIIYDYISKFFSITNDFQQQSLQQLYIIFSIFQIIPYNLSVINNIFHQLTTNYFKILCLFLLKNITSIQLHNIPRELSCIVGFYYYKYDKNYIEAIKYYDEFLLNNNQVDELYISQIYRQMAICKYNINDHKGSLEYIKKCLKLCNDDKYTIYIMSFLSLKYIKIQKSLINMLNNIKTIDCQLSLFKIHYFLSLPLSQLSNLYVKNAICWHLHRFGFNYDISLYILFYNYFYKNSPLFLNYFHSTQQFHYTSHIYYALYIYIQYFNSYHFFLNSNHYQLFELSFKKYLHYHGYNQLSYQILKTYNVILYNINIQSSIIPSLSFQFLYQNVTKNFNLSSFINQILNYISLNLQSYYHHIHFDDDNISQNSSLNYCAIIVLIQLLSQTTQNIDFIQLLFNHLILQSSDEFISYYCLFQLYIFIILSNDSQLIQQYYEQSIQKSLPISSNSLLNAFYFYYLIHSTTDTNSINIYFNQLCQLQQSLLSNGGFHIIEFIQSHYQNILTL